MRPGRRVPQRATTATPGGLFEKLLLAVWHPPAGPTWRCGIGIIGD